MRRKSPGVKIQWSIKLKTHSFGDAIINLLEKKFPSTITYEKRKSISNGHLCSKCHLGTIDAIILSGQCWRRWYALVASYILASGRWVARHQSLSAPMWHRGQAEKLKGTPLTTGTQAFSKYLVNMEGYNCPKPTATLWTPNFSQWFYKSKQYILWNTDNFSSLMEITKRINEDCLRE